MNFLYIRVSEINGSNLLYIPLHYNVLIVEIYKKIKKITFFNRKGRDIIV